MTDHRRHLFLSLAVYESAILHGTHAARQTRWTVHRGRPAGPLADRRPAASARSWPFRWFAFSGLGRVAAVLAGHGPPGKRGERSTGRPKPPRHIALDEDQLLGYALLADGSLVAFRPDNGELVARQEFLQRHAAHGGRFRSAGRAGRLRVRRRHGAAGQHPFRHHVCRAGRIARAAARPASRRRGRCKTRRADARTRRVNSGCDDWSPSWIHRSKLPARAAFGGSTIRPGPAERCFACCRPRAGSSCAAATSSREPADRRNDCRNRPAANCPGIRPPDKGAARLSCSFPTRAITSSRPGRMARCWTSTPATSTTRNSAKQIDLVPEAGRAADGTAVLARQRDAVGRRFARSRAGLVRCPRRRKRDRRAGPTGDGPHFAGPAGAGSGRRKSLSGFVGQFALVRRRLFRSSVRLYYPTNERLVLDTRAPAGRRAERLTLAPRDNGLLGFAGQELVHWRIDPGYPEANLRALFWPVWYEGYAGPVAGLAVGHRVRPAPSRS